MSKQLQAGWGEDFSYGFYRRLLDCSNKTHPIRPLRDFKPNAGKVAYLRHDIDVCLDAAVALAHAEAEWGYSSTYMFIPTSPLYQVSSPDGRAKLREIVDLGHEVALHFDVGTAGITDVGYNDALAKAVREQANGIADIIGAPVLSVSFHRPQRQLLHGPETFGGYINSYAVSLLEFYKSDSKGVWRDGDPIAAVEAAAGSTEIMQLLTHPIWWGKHHMEPVPRLEAFYKRAVSGLTDDERARFMADLQETLPGVDSSGGR